MVDDNSVVLIVTAIFGSFCQEVLHWYDLRNSLEDDKYRRLIRSYAYWVVTSLTILISGFGIWIMYGDQIKVKSAYFILGASFPLLFKKAVSSVGDRGDINLGTSVIKDYFFS